MKLAFSFWNFQILNYSYLHDSHIKFQFPTRIIACSTSSCHYKDLGFSWCISFLDYKYSGSIHAFSIWLKSGIYLFNYYINTCFYFQDMLKIRDSLPISVLKGDILKLLKENNVLVVCGETGSGKTTQVKIIFSLSLWNFLIYFSLPCDYVATITFYISRLYTVLFLFYFFNHLSFPTFQEQHCSPLSNWPLM